MKNKIHKYDFLIVGAGLIGAIAALALVKKKFKVLVIDKKVELPNDDRTLAVNANSIDFLKQLGIWNKLKSQPQKIDKIIIEDNINEKPLIFENDEESMGNVILNKEMSKVARQKLVNLKILKIVTNLDISKVLPDKLIFIDNKNYSFNKVIISIGKNIVSDLNHKTITFDQKHQSYVGFFKHSKDHNNTAYEFFTDKGPLAILPAPSANQKKSTFIYSSKEDTDRYQIQKLINKKIINSHGKLIFDQSMSKFPIIPHLIKYNDNFIYIGDSLKSIHPVAGQGWNLGIKDIQTLCKLLDQYSLEEKNINSFYYSRRIVESSIFLSFTSLLNFFYENKSQLNKEFVKAGFTSLRKVKFLRNIFIKQAMGRINLTD